MFHEFGILFEVDPVYYLPGDSQIQPLNLQKDWYLQKVNIFCSYCISLFIFLNITSLRFSSRTPNLFLIKISYWKRKLYSLELTNFCCKWGQEFITNYTLNFLKIYYLISRSFFSLFYIHMGKAKYTRGIQKVSSVCEYCRCSAAVTMVRMLAEFFDSLSRHGRNL